MQRAIRAGKLTREVSRIARRDRAVVVEGGVSVRVVEAVSVGKAASELSVSPATVRNWVEKGYLHAFRLPSGVRRIPRSELDRLINDYFAFAPAQLGREETLSMSGASDDGVWVPQSDAVTDSSDHPSTE